MDVLSESIGLIAAFLTTSAFVPQAVKTIRTKDTSSISLGMYILFTTGIVFWLIYGFAINSLPVILSNSVTILLSLVILGYKLRYK